MFVLHLKNVVPSAPQHDPFHPTPEDSLNPSSCFDKDPPAYTHNQYRMMLLLSSVALCLPRRTLLVLPTSERLLGRAGDKSAATGSFRDGKCKVGKVCLVLVRSLRDENNLMDSGVYSETCRYKSMSSKYEHNSNTMEKKVTIKRQLSSNVIPYTFDKQ